MRHIRRIILTLMLMLTAMTASAQMSIRRSMVHRVMPDSADVAHYSKRHFWRAAGEVVGFNLGLWAFDRYVQKGDFAYISLHSISENFKHGFMWDNDKLGTNMFLHPYNGNLYYNAARSNGFNFWQSELFAIGGSAMWELFMECEYPSTNDIIATPIGGACIGETLFRASDALIDDRQTGWNRAGREIGVFVISPMRGLTRLLTGDMWRHSPTRGNMFGTPNFMFQMSLGYRLLELRQSPVSSGGALSFQLLMEYGDRFEVRSSKPYDYFTFRIDLNASKSQPVLSQLNIKGRLIARELLENKKTHMSVGLYQHYDFYDSDTIHRPDGHIPYKLAIPASLGVGIMVRDELQHGIQVDGFLHANGVILGGILSDYYDVDERNYNMASGFSIKAGANIVFGGDRLSLSAKHEYYRMFTWSGYSRDIDLRTVNRRTINVQGDYSVASFNMTEFRADLKLWRNLNFSAMLNFYHRSTHYRFYPHVISSSLAARLMLTYRF